MPHPAGLAALYMPLRVGVEQLSNIARGDHSINDKRRSTGIASACRRNYQLACITLSTKVIDDVYSI